MDGVCLMAAVLWVKENSGHRLPSDCLAGPNPYTHFHREFL